MRLTSWGCWALALASSSFCRSFDSVVLGQRLQAAVETLQQQAEFPAVAAPVAFADDEGRFAAGQIQRAINQHRAPLGKGQTHRPQLPHRPGRHEGQGQGGHLGRLARQIQVEMAVALVALPVQAAIGGPGLVVENHIVVAAHPTGGGEPVEGHVHRVGAPEAQFQRPGRQRGIGAGNQL